MNEQESCAVSRTQLSSPSMSGRNANFQLSSQALRNEELLVCAALVNMTGGIYF